MENDLQKHMTDDAQLRHRMERILQKIGKLEEEIVSLNAEKKSLISIYEVLRKKTMKSEEY